MSLFRSLCTTNDISEDISKLQSQVAQPNEQEILDNFYNDVNVDDRKKLLKACQTGDLQVILLLFYT